MTMPAPLASSNHRSNCTNGSGSSSVSRSGITLTENSCPEDTARSRLRVPLIDKKVDQHARDRDVHPERERPLRYAAMLRNAHLQSVAHRENRQRNDRSGEDGGRREKREIERPYPARPWEVGHHTTPQDVIDDVAHQKHERRRAARQ